MNGSTVSTPLDHSVTEARKVDGPVKYDNVWDKIPKYEKAIRTLLLHHSHDDVAAMFKDCLEELKSELAVYGVPPVPPIEPGAYCTISPHSSPGSAVTRETLRQKDHEA